jgi:tRNA pseudouridine32 synthase/23S rRNA pseudouridine746 synthase
MEPIEIEIKLDRACDNCVDLLAMEASLPKGRIKDAMQKGAVWLVRGGRQRRLRRVKSSLRSGDLLRMYYNPLVLELVPQQPALVHDAGDYSIWDKPQMMLSSGSRFGDHCAMSRWIEVNLKPQRPVFLVHRLDRAARGLMVFGHRKRTAAVLSEAFRLRKVEKRYAVLVRGELKESGTIRTPLDGKESISHYLPVRYSATGLWTELEVVIESGRKHQIRRHLSSIGHPVVGDRLYGGDDSAQLALVAKSLSFQCPASHRQVSFSAPYELGEPGEERAIA